MQSLVCQLKSYIQPFERGLALRELQVLTGSAPAPLAGGESAEYVVDTEMSVEDLAGRLSYWERVDGLTSVYTAQVLHESTVNLVRNGTSISELQGLLPFRDQVPLPNRRALRYGTHGVHEYRGKFFPQLVRALINIADVPPGGLVADPMVGSGTTPVEAVTAGRDAVGLDLNPLSVLMARTKTLLLGVPADELARSYERVRSRLLADADSANGRGRLAYLESLPEQDQKYLAAWFAETVLADLDRVMAAVLDEPSGPFQDLLRLALSNILRRVSWQRDDDLRVRREIRTDVEWDAIAEFLQQIGRSIRIVIAFNLQRGPEHLGHADIAEGDARDISSNWAEHLGRVDAVITSPPYATALPYLDTDRLSLCYLGLLSRPQHRVRDQGMIGNREITESGRKRLLGQYALASGELPKDVADLISRVHDLNENSEVGFRRRNMSALLSKYFSDMRLVFGGIHGLLRPGGAAFVVVGSNHTVAGGTRVDIETARLLGLVAQQAGLRLDDELPMEMLVSRDIFRRNAGPSESILMFTRP
jgi:site-specific DNA-methyltransferase (cytosine-N4-specific)